MNKIVHTIIFLSMISLVACGQEESESSESKTKNEPSKKEADVDDTEDSQTASVIDLDASDFKSVINPSIGILLDVRTPQEVAGEHLKDASFIDVYDPKFADKINMMDKSKEIYVYCKGGGRSAQAADILLQNGFKKVYNLQGGIMAWNNEGYETVQTEESHNDSGSSGLNSQDFDKIIAENDLVLVDYYAKWCVPCKKMMPVMEEITTEYEGKAHILMVDVDASDALVKEQKVAGVPVLVLYKNGEKVWSANGEQSKEVLKKQLDDYLMN